MRLSFELMLKELFDNKLPLEKQIKEVGKRLKEAGVSEELRNLLDKMIDYYAKYQNTHVKHDDNVKETEVEVMIELTSVIMKHLVKTIATPSIPGPSSNHAD